jgi:hypothetical protein
VVFGQKMTSTPTPQPTPIPTPQPIPTPTSQPTITTSPAPTPVQPPTPGKKDNIGKIIGLSIGFSLGALLCVSGLGFLAWKKRDWIKTEYNRYHGFEPVN